MLRTVTLLSSLLFILAIAAVPMSAQAVPGAYPPGEHGLSGRTLRCVLTPTAGGGAVLELVTFSGTIDGRDVNHLTLTLVFTSLDSFSCGTHPLHPLQVSASGTGSGVGT